MKQRIIQMIENSTGDYHYPVTLYEAIKDSVGTSLEEILRKKLLEFGLDYDAIVDKKIEDAETYIISTLEEGDIRELREQIILINRRLSSKESQISYLASNWISGILSIELTDIYKDTPRTLYISPTDVEPKLAVTNDYWMTEEDYTYIRVKSSDDTWSSVSENTAIMLYGMTTIYAERRGHYYIESGTNDPVSLGINYDRIGDIYIAVQDKIIPYIWLGTLWNRLNDHPDVEIGAKSPIDPIVDLVCSRKVSVSYSTTPNDSDYRYDGISWYSNYTIDDTTKRFLRSLLPETLTDTVLRYVHVGPKKPTLSSSGDAWISPRDNKLYINASTNDIPVWVLQVNDINSSTNVKCTNLYYKTERFNAFEDRQLWMDIRTGVYSTSNIVDQVDGFGVQEFYGNNKSIGQKVRVKPNTLYTFSMTMKPKQLGDHPIIQFLADGCEIHNTSIMNNSSMLDEGYVRYWMLFTTGPNIYESTCRIETVSGESILCYAPCLQEGSNQEWTPSLSDSILGLEDVLQDKSTIVNIYREYDTISPTPETPILDSYIWIKDNGNTFQLYERDHWNILSYNNYPGLAESVESIYSIYTQAGVTKITTSHDAPNNPSVGDYWILDDYTVVRYNGSSWGNISGILASETAELSATLKVSNDLLVQSLFLESSIDAGDLYDIASQLDPTITLYRQNTEPTDHNIGDIWENTLTGIILRYNGTEWVATGSAQVSNMKQTIDDIETSVDILYDGGSGRNYIQNSISMAFPDYVTAVYTDLEPDSHYVLSVQSSTAIGITQYTVRLMDDTHTVDYDNKIFTIGHTLNLWRFNLNSVPSGVTAHLVITYANEGSDLILNKVQLEKGYVYTDWKAAIEDTEASIAVANSNIASVQSNLVGNTAEIDRISQELIDAINISNEALARAVTVTQTADSFRITASELSDTVSDMQTQLATYSSVFNFKPDGLQISSLVNGIKSDISTYYRSNGVYFWSDSAGSDVGYVTADGLNICNARVRLGGILSMGNFKWKPRSNGSLSLICDL